jgi:tetratricopeptide (TPR) repeat protein
MEEEDEEDSLVLLEQADESEAYTESARLLDLKDKKNIRPFLQSLMQSVEKREKVLGRYSHEAAQTYLSIGNIYMQTSDARAVVMFRTSFRIESFLYGKCNGKISGALKLVLERRGLSGKEIDTVQKDVLDSMRNEIEGDIIRRFGDRRAAALEKYQKAAKIEELSFGKDNPDLAYLWRKMACLVSIKNVHLHSIDYEYCDRPGSRWVQQSKQYLSENVCAAITKGDKYYFSMLYGKAVAEYIKATNIDRQKPPFRTRRKISRPVEKSSILQLEKELQKLLSSGHITMTTASGGTNEQSLYTIDSGRGQSKLEETNCKSPQERQSVADVKLKENIPQDESFRSSTGAHTHAYGKSLLPLPAASPSTSSSNLGKREERILLSKEVGQMQESNNYQAKIEEKVIGTSSATMSNETVSEDASLYPESKDLSSASLITSPSKSKSKSESYLIRMTAKTGKAAAKLASKTTKKLRKKNKSSKQKSLYESLEQNNKNEINEMNPLLNKSDSYLVLLDPLPTPQVMQQVKDEMSTAAPTTSSQSSMGSRFSTSISRELLFIDDDIDFNTTFDREKVPIRKVSRLGQQQEKIVPIVVSPKTNSELSSLEVSNNGENNFLVFEDPHSNSSYH